MLQTLTLDWEISQPSWPVPQMHHHILLNGRKNSDNWDPSATFLLKATKRSPSSTKLALDDWLAHWEM